MTLWVSPKHKPSDFGWPLSLDEKIVIFLDRTNGWQLDIADQCINGKQEPNGDFIREPIPHSGYAALSIIFSYFEMIAKYHGGFDQLGQSGRYFKEGVFLVFPELRTAPQQEVDDLLDILYEGVRCGLYHGGITARGITISSDYKVSISLDIQSRRLKVNPHLLVRDLRAHLKSYGEQLQDPNNVLLRKNFEKRFDWSG